MPKQHTLRYHTQLSSSSSPPPPSTLFRLTLSSQQPLPHQLLPTTFATYLVALSSRQKSQIARVFPESHSTSTSYGSSQTLIHGLFATLSLIKTRHSIGRTEHCLRAAVEEGGDERVGRQTAGEAPPKTINKPEKLQRPPSASSCHHHTPRSTIRFTFDSNPIGLLKRRRGSFVLTG